MQITANPIFAGIGELAYMTIQIFFPFSFMETLRRWDFCLSMGSWRGGCEGSGVMSFDQEPGIPTTSVAFLQSATDYSDVGSSLVLVVIYVSMELL